LDSAESSPTAPSARREEEVGVGSPAALEDANETVLGTVTQPEVGFLNDILGEDERELTAREYTLFGSVSDGQVTSSSLVEDRQSGEYDIYQLDNEQLNTLRKSQVLDPAFALGQTPAGVVTVGASLDRGDLEGPRGADALSGSIAAANENVGNRYVGPIVGIGEDDTLLQQVSPDEYVAHRAEALAGIDVDTERPIEIAYEYDGPAVRKLDTQDVSLER